MNKEFFSDILVIAFTFVLVGTRLVAIDPILMNLSIAIMGLLCYLFFLLTSKRNDIKVKSYVYGFFLSVCMMLSIAYNGNANITNVLWIWAYMGVGLLLYEYGIKKLSGFIIFYTVNLYFISLALEGQIMIDEILETGSANNLSVISLFTMILFYLSRRESLTNLIDFIPVFIVMFVSLWTGSRAGLLSVVIFYVLVIIIELLATKKQRWKLYIVISLSIILIGAFVIQWYEMFSVVFEGKLERSGMESSRTLIWNDYFKGLTDNIGNFVFGVPGLDPQYHHLKEYSGNTHNIFLMLHSKYGLIGLVGVVFYILKAVRKLFHNKQWILLCLLMVIIIRGMFDWVAFPGSMDVLLWYFIFYASLNIAPVYVKNQQFRTDSIVVRTRQKRNKNKYL